MKARAADVKDISSRIIQNLLGEDEEYLVDNEPSIIVAEDISPSETDRYIPNAAQSIA